MFETIRRIFGPIAVGVIIGAIALVFIFYGVFNPRNTRGLSPDALAATVNGDTISMREFAREYQQRIEFYQNMMKGKIDNALLQQLGIKQQVLEELVRRKLLLQEAHRIGLVASDEELRHQITELPYFKKEGRFDANLYKNILTANQQSPGQFEELVREDLLRNRLIEFMKGRTRVSEKEIQDEFLVNEDYRQVEYVLIDRETIKKKLSVSEKEIADFLATDINVKAAQSYYEQNKMAYLKSTPKVDKKNKKQTSENKPEFFAFDEVKTKVASELLKDRRSDEISKLSHALATEIYEKAKNSPSDLRNFAKSKNLELKTSAKFNRLLPSIPEIGESRELQEDAFKDHSMLEKTAKLYPVRSGYVIALNLKAFKPELTKLNVEKDKITQQALRRKEQIIFEQWMSEMRTKAKVTLNKSIEKSDEVE